MKDEKKRLVNYMNLIRRQTGKTVKPFRSDGYVNMLNKYGTSRDTTEQYKFTREASVGDDVLSSFYEGNGLFARIIDAPAEECVKHGFKLKDVVDDAITNAYKTALDDLDWEENFMTAMKWTRLFGGAIIVMLIEDGRGLDEPVDWYNVERIESLRVYERAVVQPDYATMFSYDAKGLSSAKGARLGTPEYYHVFSKYGSFTVHESRCLVFQNGKLPESTSSSNYEYWGMPEYVRINKAIRDTEIAHGSVVRLLDRSVQAIYRMKDLASELSTEEGEERVLRRLQTIDMARGLLNSITIDSEGEDYGFSQFSFTGVSDSINNTCNYLSAITNIPQTVLFGRSPAGMNATGEGDMENYYNYIERMQKRILRGNLRYLVMIALMASANSGEIDDIPNRIDVEFEPLWSMSEAEKLAVEAQKVQIQASRAQLAQIYIGAGVLDAKEVRKELAKTEEFNIETMLDDLTEEELEANAPKPQEGSAPPAGGGEAPPAEGSAPAGEELPSMPQMQGDSAYREDADEVNSWITTKEHHRIPLDENGISMAGGGGTLKGKDFSKAKTVENGKERSVVEKKMTKDERLSSGANEKPTKFTSLGSLKEHYNKHKDEFSVVGLKTPKNKEEYLEQAAEFLSKPVGGNIKGYAYIDERGRKGYCRFDTKTLEYGKCSADGRVITYFPAKVVTKDAYNRPIPRAQWRGNARRANGYYEHFKEEEYRIIGEKGSEKRTQKIEKKYTPKKEERQMTAIEEALMRAKEKKERGKRHDAWIGRCKKTWRKVLTENRFNVKM